VGSDKVIATFPRFEERLIGGPRNLRRGLRIVGAVVNYTPDLVIKNSGHSVLLSQLQNTPMMMTTIAPPMM
jgi:hypothetical protein